MLAFHGYLIHVMVFLRKSQMHQTISANRYFHMLVQMRHVGLESITRLDYRGDLPSGDCSRHPEMVAEGRYNITSQTLAYTATYLHQMNGTYPIVFVSLEMREDYILSPPTNPEIPERKTWYMVLCHVYSFLCACGNIRMLVVEKGAIKRNADVADTVESGYEYSNDVLIHQMTTVPSRVFVKIQTSLGRIIHNRGYHPLVFQKKHSAHYHVIQNLPWKLLLFIPCF